MARRGASSGLKPLPAPPKAKRRERETLTSRYIDAPDAIPEDLARPHDRAQINREQLRRRLIEAGL